MCDDTKIEHLCDPRLLKNGNYDLKVRKIENFLYKEGKKLETKMMKRSQTENYKLKVRKTGNFFYKEEKVGN